MVFTKLEIEDIVLIEPNILADSRGYFFESFKSDIFKKSVCDTEFVFEFKSKSVKNTLRGLHYQANPYSQSKLVNVCYGSVLDVVVDIRSNSKTFGKYLAIELSESNHRQLFIPKGFAHGFLVLSDIAIMHYKLDNYYDKDCYTGVNFFDEKLNISLPIERKDIVISEKDELLPYLDNAILF